MESFSNCTATSRLCLEKAVTDDYKWLYQYHYRARRTGPVAGVWVLRPREKRMDRRLNLPVGVIVYGMPSANLAARTIATGGELAQGDWPQRLGEVNRRLRTIRRVIVEPRYRGLGLAAQLVRRTLPLIGTEMVEAYTVMGSVCGFFEKAGMEAYCPPERKEAIALRAALVEAGIGEYLWCDSEAVFRRLEKLNSASAARLERRISGFLKAYKNRRFMPRGEDRIRFVLSRLSGRPVYYLWRSPALVNRQLTPAA